MNAIVRPTLSSVFGLLGASSHMKVTPLNPKTGRFPTSQEATVVTSVSTNLDYFKSLLLMPDNEFVQGQIKHLRYFDEILTIEQLEAVVSDHALADTAPSLLDSAGIERAYHIVDPFLWLRFRTREVGDQVFAQFVLINPDGLQELLVVERALDDHVAGVNDQNTWYPLFNALVQYIDSNSLAWSAVRKAKSNGVSHAVVDLFPSFSFLLR